MQNGTAVVGTVGGLALGAVAGVLASRRLRKGDTGATRATTTAVRASGPAPVARHVGERWANRTLDVDGNQYDACTFADCVFRFRGSAPVGFRNCRMERCAWAFTGPAKATLRLLSDIYGGFGLWGQQVVERVFDGVRIGAYRDGRHDPTGGARPTDTVPLQSTVDATASGAIPAAAVDPLAARLGGTPDGFAAAYGAPVPNEDPASPYVRYRVAGPGRAQVFYHRDRALIVRLRAARSPATTLDEPSVVNWSPDAADAVVRRFLPADAEIGPRQPWPNGFLVRCRSAALGGALEQADYDQSGAVGKPGACRYTCRVAADGRVVAIVVAIGDEKGAAPGAATAAEAVRRAR